MAKKCLFIRGRPLSAWLCPFEFMSSCKTKRLEVSWLYLAESDSSCRESLFFFFFFCPCSVAYGILFQQLGIEPRPSAVEVLRSQPLTTKEVLEKIASSHSPFYGSWKVSNWLLSLKAKEGNHRVWASLIRLVKWPPVSCRISARQLSLLDLPWYCWNQAQSSEMLGILVWCLKFSVPRVRENGLIDIFRLELGYSGYMGLGLISLLGSAIFRRKSSCAKRLLLKPNTK